MCKIMLKYGHLMLPGAFLDKFTPDIDFIDKAVVQCYDAPVVKILKIIYEWSQVNFHVNTYEGLMYYFWPSCVDRCIDVHSCSTMLFCIKCQS